MINYGFDAIQGVPEIMDAWGMRIDHPAFVREDVGSYVLVGCEPASIELHHEVVVLDENGDRFNDPYIVFGFPGGGGRDFSHLLPRTNYWFGMPTVLNGNVVKAGAEGQSGYARHTFQSGGEDIWVWDVQDGILELPSPIVRNCTWVGTPAGQFEHTGVKLTFQRRRAGIVPQGDRIVSLERRVESLEQQVGRLVLEVQRLGNYDALMEGHE